MISVVLGDATHFKTAATLDAPSQPGPLSDTAKIYAAKPGAQQFLAFLAFLMSALGLIPLKQILDWLAGGPMPEGGIFIAALSTPFFLPIALLCASNALRGLPRLTVTSEGVKFESGIRTKWASWNRLGPFAVKTAYSTRFRPCA